MVSCKRASGARLAAVVCLLPGCAIGDQSPQTSAIGSGLGNPTTGNEGGIGDDDDDPDQDDDDDDSDPDDDDDDDDSDDDDDTDSGPTSGNDDSTGTDSVGADCVSDDECNDGDACTDDACGPDGTCANTMVDCNDGVPCTMDSCSPATGCANTPDDSACGNADACDGLEVCDAMLGCMPGIAVDCGDGEPCTQDVCNPADGSCSNPAQVACNGGDGCCPLGCSALADNDCVCTNNAPGATGSSSDGGSDAFGYGPANWTDGVDQAACVAANCFECYGWVDNNTAPASDFMALSWGSEQIIGSMVVDTSPAGSGACATTFNRNIEDGTVQYWNGAAWVDAQAFSNETGDLTFNFDPPLQTTQIRLFDITATPSGDNSLAFEWYVYEPLDCTP